MPQSLAQIYLHIVFSTKSRQPFLRDPSVRRDMHQYLAGICHHAGSPAIEVGGVDDHVHVLCRLAKTQAVSDLIKTLKQASTTWGKQTHPSLSNFYWQRGYGAFSISPGHVDDLRRYILDQEQHHKSISFQDEFRRLCTKYGVQLDERYAWD